MIAKIKKQGASFQPFTITFEFDTVEQYKAFDRAMNRYIVDVHRDTLMSYAGTGSTSLGEDQELVNLFREIIGLRLESDERRPLSQSEPTIAYGYNPNQIK